MLLWYTGGTSPVGWKWALLSAARRAPDPKAALALSKQDAAFNLGSTEPLEYRASLKSFVRSSFPRRFNQRYYTGSNGSSLGRIMADRA